jgi:hypothetical protein
MDGNIVDHLWHWVNPNAKAALKGKNREYIMG